MTTLTINDLTRAYHEAHHKHVAANEQFDRIEAELQEASVTAAEAHRKENEARRALLAFVESSPPS